MSLIAQRLIAWQEKYGRHHLPWQGQEDPYAIWLSEIMLQQTQVKTVIPYYQRFIKRFPNIQSLAQANQDEVLTLWSGLGYYARARNLHQTARTIMQDYQGVFPQIRENIQQLPGIGRSTAAAITVFAYGQSDAILDGNVKRVFARYFGIERYPGETETLKKLWRIAEGSLPKNSAAEEIKIYTQALMDLGSMLCTRRSPLCYECPLQKDCVAYGKNRVAQLPVPKPKKTLPIKKTVFVIYQNQQKLLLKKRPGKGIWGGLWCFPECNINEKNKIAINSKMSTELPGLLHTFTHYKLWIYPWLLQMDVDISEEQTVWAKPEEAFELAIPAPVKKLLQRHFLP